jgi:hypothetical protein
MDRRERAPKLEELLRTAGEALQARIWTALPGVVQSYNAAKQTVVVQPAINGRQRLSNGRWSPTQMPLLLDCPVQWQGGGGATLTFPIKAGDECLVVFSSRCIDRWFGKGFASGGTPEKPNAENDPPQYRMHNLSDGFALVGVRSLPRALPVDTDNATLMSDDASTYYKLNPTTQAIDIVAPGGITMNGVTIDASGNVVVPGTFTADGVTIGDGIVVETHTHSGVQTGGGISGPPVP